jgi:hypothetical protein
MENKKKLANATFYSLSRLERAHLVAGIKNDILEELKKNKIKKSVRHFENTDTYIRKAAYLSCGQIYFSNKNIQQALIKMMDDLLLEGDFKIRQTVINATGEIGKKDFAVVQHFFDKGLFDAHHSVRNAVIGSVKKMGEVNPGPVLNWAKQYLHHKDKEIRREICHGIELRGRKHPQDILPLLQELQYDQTARVRNTLVHVIGQIAYKKGCLAITVEHLKTWKNKEFVHEALKEIIAVHDRYSSFAALSQKEARRTISESFGGKW